MPNYQLAWDAGKKIVTLRVDGFVSDTEAELMAADMLGMANKARREHGLLRVLFDNQNGMVFSPRGAAALDFLKKLRAPADRYAVLVSGTLNRLQADRSRSDNTQIFTTEAEAVAWLTERAD